MKVRERDLRHDADPVRFGTAMMVCEGYAPDCSYHGRCVKDGECFAAPGHLVAARMIEKLIPSPCPAGQHFAYLRQAADMLRKKEIHW